MDSFRPAAFSFSSFAFAQAGTFLFQFNPETDKPVFADPELLPELNNLRLAHSIIREALEKGSDQDSPRLPDLLEDLALYTNAVRKCSTTAQHLRLQGDPRFLRDARVVSRQRELLERVQAARRCSEKLQYRLDKDSSLAARLNVASEDIQHWLDVSLDPGDFRSELPYTLGSPSSSVFLRQWVKWKRKLLWCKSTNNDSDKALGSAVAHALASSVDLGPGFIGYTSLSHSSKQLELVESFCRLLRQLVASPECEPSAVLKGWFLSHRETRPTREDAQRILLNELRRQRKPYLVISSPEANKDDLEALLPIFQDILKTGCRLFVICPFPLPAQLKSETVTLAPVTGASFRKNSNDDSLFQGYITDHDPFSATIGPDDLNSIEPQGLPDPFDALYLPPLTDPTALSLGTECAETDDEEDQWDTMLSKLINDTTPVAKVSVKMLVWVAFALRRFTIGEIKVAIADGSGISSHMNPIGRLEDFVRLLPCSDEVDVRDTAMRPFLRQRLRGAEEIHVDGPDALLAERCLSYIGSVPSLGKLPEDDGEFQELIDRHPPLSYAGRFWGEHASRVMSTSGQHTNLLANLLENRQVEEVCASIFSRSEQAAKRHRGAYERMTGMHLASAFGLVNVVSRMIGSGKFSPCLRTDDGWTALHWAAEKSRENVVAFLLALPNTESLMACRTDSEGYTALHIAVKHYHSLMVESMLKANANVDAQDGRGRTSLYLAVWSGQEGVVEQLLSSGANPNIPSIYGTPLHCAVKRGTSALVRTLISASGSRLNLNIKDILPLTALQEAQARGRDDVAAILLEAGAEPGLAFTQAYFLGIHRGLSSKDSLQTYEIDPELSAQVKVGKQCICHVLRSHNQVLEHVKGQETLGLGSRGDLTAPTKVFRKTFDLASDAKGQVQKYLLSEWQILFKLRHPHIVRYIDSDEDPHNNEFLLYMEYCDKGDLESCHGIQLKDLTSREDKRYGFVEDEATSKLRPLTGVEVWAMIWQLASALAYLHYGLAIKPKNGLYNAGFEGPWAYIIHRDVKPANKTIRLTAKLKDELLNCQPFKGFLDSARGIDEDTRPTSLEAMEVAYRNLRTASGSFSNLPRAVLEEMRAVHQVLGRWGGSYLFQSFLLTAELLDSSQPLIVGSTMDDRKSLVNRLWLLLDDGAEETFTGNYELTAHLLILMEGRSEKEKLLREQELDRVLGKGGNANRQWVKSGWSALHVAAQEGRLSAAKALLRHGAKVDLKDNHGMTAKHYAEENGLTEMVALLEGSVEQPVVERREGVRGISRKRRKLM
ncbi:hypothetical protein ACHAPT_004341 [Fusarium lateritium]